MTGRAGLEQPVTNGTMPKVDVERAMNDAPVWMDADTASGWSSGWNAAIEWLRSLPVEQRMEAMGMVEVGYRARMTDQTRVWREPDA